MAHFFESVKHVLAENGRVCMSLVYGQHERWDIVHQANRFSLNPDAIIDFEPNLWPGYEVKRNKHGKSFKNEPTKRQHRCDMRSIAFRFSTSSTSTTSTVIPHSFLEQQIKYMSLEDTESASKTVTTTTSLAKPFICPQCSRGFSTLRGRDNHVHTMHILKIRGEEWKSEGPKMYACDHCPKTFKMQEDLWQHAINKHTEIDSSELPELKQVLGEEGNTSITPPTAVTNEGGVKDTEYDYTPCSICGQAVVRRDWGMLLHLETLKPAVGLDMSCPLCKNQSFIESRALFQHYKFCRLKQKKVE